MIDVNMADTGLKSRILYLLFVFLAAALTACVPFVSNDGDAPVLPPVEQNPFYTLFEQSELDTVSFEGTIRAVSLIPDPEKNDYPNCLYTVFVELDSVQSSSVPDSRMEYEVLVNVPVMKDLTILKSNIFLPGDRIACICAEYDAMPQEIREIQLSDDIQSFEHQQYYALSIAKVREFQPGGNRDFAKRKITILPIQPLPKDENAAMLRQTRIRKELSRIEEELKQHGGSFAAWREEYRMIAARYQKLCDENYKGWTGDSYFTAGGEETAYETRDYIEGILPYKKYLEENNIDLILVRVPSKWDFAARVLAADDFQENPDWVEHYYECLKNDIEIVDPMPEMWKHRFDFPLFYFYTVETEMHPFEGQAFITAEVLSDVLKRYSYPKSELPVGLEDYVFVTTRARSLWPEGNPKFDPEKNIHFNRVIRDGETIGDLEVNTGSPFVFLSNSFFWYPYRHQGASVPGYTAYFLQHIPDWFYQDGIGNQMIRNLIGSQEALQKRRAVIMIKAPFMNAGGFPPLPRYLSGNVSRISLEKTLDLLSPEIRNLDDGSFLFTKDGDGLTHFTQNKDKKDAAGQFEIELTVPPCENKTACMLRLNFGEISYLTLNVLDGTDGAVIDSAQVTFGKDHRADLFFPVPDFGRNVRIQVIPLNYPEKDFSVKNIELWYY